MGVRLLRKWDEKRFIAKVIGKEIFSLLYQKKRGWCTMDKYVVFKSRKNRKDRDLLSEASMKVNCKNSKGLA